DLCIAGDRAGAPRLGRRGRLMARRPKKLRVNEISVVDRGAGDGVRVLLVKRAADGSPREIRLPAPAPTMETKMTFKSIVKRAIEQKDLDQATLGAATTRKAVKAFPAAASEAIAFAKYIAVNPALRQVIDAAPKAATAPPRSSFEALARGAADFCTKQ